MSLNLLNWRKHQQRQQHVAVTSIAVAILAVAVSFYSVIYWRWQQSLTVQQNKIAQLRHTLQQIVVSDAKQKYNTLQPEVNFALQQRQQLYRLLRLLYDSQQSLPESAYLTAMDWHAPVLTLQGASTAPDALARWQQQLSDNKYVQQLSPAYRHNNEFTLKITAR